MPDHTNVSMHLQATTELLADRYGLEVRVLAPNRAVLFNQRVVLEVVYEDVSRSLNVAFGRRGARPVPTGSWSLQFVQRALGLPGSALIIVTDDVDKAFRSLVDQLRSIEPAIAGDAELIRRIAHRSLDHTLSMSNRTKRSWAQNAIPLAAEQGDYEKVLDFLTWLDDPLTAEEARQLVSARARVSRAEHGNEAEPDSNRDSNRSG